MSKGFDYAIPKAVWIKTGFRAADGHLVETLKKQRSATRKAKLGASRRRHIKEVTVDGVEHTYHATKGWRARKA